MWLVLGLRRLAFFKFIITRWTSLSFRLFSLSVEQKWAFREIPVLIRGVFKTILTAKSKHRENGLSFILCKFAHVFMGMKYRYFAKLSSTPLFLMHRTAHEQRTYVWIIFVFINWPIHMEKRVWENVRHKQRLVRQYSYIPPFMAHGLWSAARHDGSDCHELPNNSLHCLPCWYIAVNLPTSSLVRIILGVPAETAHHFPISSSAVQPLRLSVSREVSNILWRLTQNERPNLKSHMKKAFFIFMCRDMELIARHCKYTIWAYTYVGFSTLSVRARCFTYLSVLILSCLERRKQNVTLKIHVIASTRIRTAAFHQHNP